MARNIFPNDILVLCDTSQATETDKKKLKRLLYDENMGLPSIQYDQTKIDQGYGMCHPFDLREQLESRKRLDLYKIGDKTKFSKPIFKTGALYKYLCLASEMDKAVDHLHNVFKKDSPFMKDARSIKECKVYWGQEDQYMIDSHDVIFTEKWNKE